jgi:hypothetical protein
MNNRPTIKLLVCALISLALTLAAYGQDNEVKLKDQRISIKMDKQPLGVVFRYMMENYDLLIGFEKSILDFGNSDFHFETNLSGEGRQSFEDKDSKWQIDVAVNRAFVAERTPITIDVNNERLEDVFNIIVGQMGNYKWEINDCVINITPIAGRDPRMEKLLKTKISKFTFEKGFPIKAITTQIKQLPEFRKFLAENKLYFTGVRTGPDVLLQQQYGRIINEEMNFSDLTFKELLNKITKVKRGGWIIRNKSRSGSEEGHIDIDL